MDQNVLNLIENKISPDGRLIHYAAILGLTPSQGARSPKLWNQVYEDQNIPCKMVPFDVIEEKFPELIKALRADEKFIGAALAVPYKVSVLTLLDEVEEEAQIIGAVNCIYKKDGKLIGTNTDGAGATEAYKREFGSLSGKNVAVTGLGGAGKAVATYFAKEVGQAGRLILHNRSFEKSQNLSSKLENFCQVQALETINSESLKDVDVFVNCSTVGYEFQQDSNGKACFPRFFSPIAPTNEFVTASTPREFFIENSSQILQQQNKALQTMAEGLKEDCVVYDIIYQPLQTTFLYHASLLGKKTMNGLAMNLEQAVIAFDKVNKTNQLTNLAPEEISKIMKKA